MTADGFDTPDGCTYSGPVTAPETRPGDGPRRITFEEAAARGDWVQLERKAAPETAPGQAARDPQAEREYAEFVGWMEAQGWGGDGPWDTDNLADVFTAGMRAQRNLDAAQEPKPAPAELGIAVRALNITVIALGEIVRQIDTLVEPGPGADLLSGIAHGALSEIGALAEPKPASELADAIDPAKLDLLADWFDVDDLAKGRDGRTEVQEDLRRWARLVRNARSS